MYALKKQFNKNIHTMNYFKENFYGQNLKTFIQMLVLNQFFPLKD